MMIFDIHSLNKPIDIITLTRIIFIMIPVFTAFLIDLPTANFNGVTTESGQKTQSYLPLSQYYARADNKEHEYKQRINRKSSLSWPMPF